VSLFGLASEVPLRVAAAMALIYKAVSLQELQRVHEALAAYREVLAGFADVLEPALRHSLAAALTELEH